VSRVLPPLVLLVASAFALPCEADEVETFDKLLQRTTIAQIEAVQEYVAAHPDAADVDEAYTWLFTTARSRNLEGRVLESAEAYLARDAGQRAESLARVARAIRSLARARSGEHEAALEDFRAVIESIPLRSGSSAVSVAIDLANAFQLQGQVELARGVYEEMDETFFLNPEVRRYTEGRLARLSLVGDPPPKVELEDLDGKAIDLSDYEGKIVLLDFWATNCAPCLEMLPRLKKMYGELHPRGFEIVGFSLDADAELVRDFAEKNEMPWRMAMATENGAKAIFTYHAESIPALYVVGRDGRVVASDLRGEALEQLIRRLVAEREAGGSQ
jgi:peroxiredoxin